jgi:predicted RNase H-like nuclease (RuvC/YqgF family)
MLNQNKANYYVEMLKNKELVENQQKIITQLEQQLQRKSLTIDYLTGQLTRQTNQQATSIDLLDIDPI